MSQEDDDYLSDKFLVDSSGSSSAPRTYSQIRKEAQKKSRLKGNENRTKSRRQLELESREAGLSKSLFERAKEEETTGLSSGNKALSIMMKMGFKPGQSLGRTGDQDDNDAGQAISTTTAPTVSITKDKDNSPAEDEPESRRTASPKGHTTHKTEPLPLQEWAGKKGIGLGKRAASPSSTERLAKMAKMAEDVKHRDFRERARDDYNNRRAEGRLAPAQRTCATLDERMGKPFNVLWLNPSNYNTFPPGLIEALAHHNSGVVFNEDAEDSIQTRLRKQMQADALQPVKNDDLGDEEECLSTIPGKTPAKQESSVPTENQKFSLETLEEATQFLRLQAQDRLHLVLSYLRDKHAYCFWCGVEYQSSEEMQSQCPGPEEDDHN